jgi:ATP-dependent Clp protease ATP-binding subunit ClpC
LGFSSNNTVREFANNQKEVMNKLKKTFKPEFLNRVDDIIVFHPLTEENILDIANLMISQLNQKLTDQNIKLVVADAALEFLSVRGFSEVYGARPLRREIENSLENKLSLMIIEKKINKGDVVTAKLDKQKEEIYFDVQPG